MTKTNAMRLLESAGVAFETRSYPVDETDLSGVHTASVLGLPPERLFKTLVLRGDRTGLFVCCIPCDAELDLRRAAKAAGDKGCELVAVRELLPLTGYIRGGCSPVGMKKRLPTFFDETVVLFDTIAVSAGVRGTMLLVGAQALIDYVGASVAELVG